MTTHPELKNDLLPCPFCNAVIILEEMYPLSETYCYKHPINDCLLSNYGFRLSEKDKWNSRPEKCCGARGAEACMKEDRTGAECDIKQPVFISRAFDPLTAHCFEKPVIDDGLRETIKEGNSWIDHWTKLMPETSLIPCLKNLIAHALKTREEPVEVTVEELNNILSVDNVTYEIHGYDQVAKKYPTGIKVVEGI